MLSLLYIVKNCSLLLHFISSLKIFFKSFIFNHYFSYLYYFSISFTHCFFNISSSFLLINSLLFPNIRSSFLLISIRRLHKQFLIPWIIHYLLHLLLLVDLCYIMSQYSIIIRIVFFVVALIKLLLLSMFFLLFNIVFYISACLKPFVPLNHPSFFSSSSNIVNVSSFSLSINYFRPFSSYLVFCFHYLCITFFWIFVLFYYLQIF